MNQGILNKFLLFAIGATVGSFVTWKLMDEKYKQMADREIESMREYYSEKYSEESKTVNVDDAVVAEDESELSETNTCEINDYNNIVTTQGYTQYNITNKKEDNMKKPYVIAPEEFTELQDYKAVSLKYYSDGVLTYNNDVPVEDVDNVVGYESLDHFGEYEDDSVFVRNEELRTDFEILLTPNKYYESSIDDDDDSYPEEDE